MEALPDPPDSSDDSRLSRNEQPVFTIRYPDVPMLVLPVLWG